MPFSTYCLSIILNYLEIIFFLQFVEFFRPTYLTIKMNHSNRFSLWSDGFLYLVNIYIERFLRWINKNWGKMIISNGKNCSNICISWYNHLISILHYTHFLISTENHAKCIQTITARNYMLSTNEVFQIIGKFLIVFAMQKPTIINNLTSSSLHVCSIQCIHFL